MPVAEPSRQMAPGIGIQVQIWGGTPVMAPPAPPSTETKGLAFERRVGDVHVGVSRVGGCACVLPGVALAGRAATPGVGVAGIRRRRVRGRRGAAAASSRHAEHAEDEDNG